MLSVLCAFPLLLIIHWTPANFHLPESTALWHSLLPNLWESILPGHSTLEVPETYLLLEAALKQSLIRVGIKIRHHHSGGTIQRCEYITLFWSIFPGIWLPLTSMLTCWIRQLIGRFPHYPLSFSCTSKINCLYLNLHLGICFWGTQIKIVTQNKAFLLTT